MNNLQHVHIEVGVHVIDILDDLVHPLSVSRRQSDHPLNSRVTELNSTGLNLCKQCRQRIDLLY